MRRIIKRTITIVTITWTISWRPKEAMPINVEVQPAAADTPELLVLPEGEPGPWEIEATISKEVEVSEMKTTSHPTAD